MVDRGNSARVTGSVAQSRVTAVLLVLTVLGGCARSPDGSAQWSQFKKEFVHPDGRVVDTGRGGMSHSEGQGIAMLLAVHFNDPHTFASVWEWTRANLQVRQDRLLAWSWTGDGGVTDQNNATDGDILAAWALARAGKAWDVEGYRNSAAALAREIRTRLVRRGTRGLLLLPGAEGFEKAEGPILNLSYWVFPAFTALEEVDPAPEWAELRASGLELLRSARFGRWGLPPDWLVASEKPAPATGFAPRFGYDAVRIPLYLRWARLDTPELLAPFRGYWGHFSGARFLPAWTDLSDDSVDSYDANAGIRAIARLTMAHNVVEPVRLPAPGTGDGYYATALWLLCKSAQSGPLAAR